MLTKNNKDYCLLAPVDQEEEPDMENLKIVELISSNEETRVEEPEEEITQKLAKDFLKLLREEINEEV